MYWGGNNRAGGHNTLAVQAPQMEWFLAEGASNAIFDEFILVANPNSAAVEVQIDYLGTDGIRDTDTYTVAANSRRTIHAAVDLDTRFGGRFRNRTFSARVKSLTLGNPIIVERSIYWGGIFAGGANPAGTNEAGISQLSDTWRFGEGYAGAAVQLPDLPAGRQSQPRRGDDRHDLLPRRRDHDRRHTLAAAELAHQHLGERRSGCRQLEGIRRRRARARRRSRSPPSARCTGAASARGTSSPELRLKRPSGASPKGIEDRFGGVDYDTYFLLNNAANDPVAVTATFMLEDGTGFSQNFTISGRSRYTLIAARLPAAEQPPVRRVLRVERPDRGRALGLLGRGLLRRPRQRRRAAAPELHLRHALPASWRPRRHVDQPGLRPDHRRHRCHHQGRPIRDEHHRDHRWRERHPDGRECRDHRRAHAAEHRGWQSHHRDEQRAARLPRGRPSPTRSSRRRRRHHRRRRRQPRAPWHVARRWRIYCTAFANNGVCIARARPWPFPQNCFGVDQPVGDRAPVTCSNSCRREGRQQQFMFEVVRRLRARPAATAGA